MMKKEITKYVVKRESYYNHSNPDISYKLFTDAEMAIDWARRHSTRDHIICTVFAMKGDESIRTCDKNGKAIFTKQGKVAHDLREQEDVKAFLADEAPTEPEPEPEAVHDEPKAETAEPTDEAPAPEPVRAGEVVRYYVVLQIAENRKQTKFHYKRRTFYDDEDAITFARSRLRGGCKSVTVYMYDPNVTNAKPSTFETMDAQHDAKLIRAALWAWEIFYIDRSTERDMRDSIRNALPDRHFDLKPYLSDHDNELVKHAQHFDADGTANTSLALITMLCDADIRNTHDVRLNGSIMTLAEAEEWYQEATV